MRKVFISSIIINKIDRERPTPYSSRDFDLGNQIHLSPIAYLLDANIDPGDEVAIISGITPSPVPRNNYQLIRKDLEDILDSHGVTAEFIEIDEPDTKASYDIMDSLTFGRFFKEVSANLKDGDRIYADMTFGMKCYTLGIFIAMEYAVKACSDVDVERMIYANYYNGQDTPEGIQPFSSEIVDISSLFYISSIVNNAQPGQKKSMDHFLKFIIG